MQWINGVPQPWQGHMQFLLEHHVRQQQYAVVNIMALRGAMELRQDESLERSVLYKRIKQAVIQMLIAERLPPLDEDLFEAMYEEAWEELCRIVTTPMEELVPPDQWAEFDPTHDAKE